MLNKNEKQTVSFELITAETEEIVNDTLQYYTENEEFEIADEREGGSGTVLVMINEGSAEAPHMREFQKMVYHEGKLVRLENSYSRGNLYINPRKEVYSLSYDHVDHGGSTWHHFSLENTNNAFLFKEITRIGGVSDLYANYIPAVEDGHIGFALDKLGLGFATSLANEEAQKVISSRFIPLRDILNIIINPSVYLRHWNNAVSEIDKSDNFVALDKGNTRNGYVTSREDNKYEFIGSLNMLKDDPHKALVLVNYIDGINVVSKAHIVELDEELIETSVVDGIRTFSYQVVVDGDVYNLSMQEPSGWWEPETQDNKDLATQRKEDNGKPIVFIPLSEDKIRESVSKGVYYRPLVNQALSVYRESLFSKKS